MWNKTNLESIRDREIADHKKRLAAIQSLLDLVDPATQTVPESFVDMLFPAEKPIPQPIRRAVPLEPSNILTSVEEAVLVHMQGFSPEVEWTSASIREGLEAKGYILPQNREAAMNVISLSLGSLVAKNKISRIYQGRGRDPHRYRVGIVPILSTSEEPAEAGS